MSTEVTCIIAPNIFITTTPQNSGGGQRSLNCPFSPIIFLDHPLFMPTYSCRTDSCRPIHARPIRARYDRFMPVPIHAKDFSCPLLLIHAGTYSCQDLFMPWKSPKIYMDYSCPFHAQTCLCPTWPFHASSHSCPHQPYSCPILFMPSKDYSCPYLFMPRTVHAHCDFFMPVPIHARVAISKISKEKKPTFT